MLKFAMPSGAEMRKVCKKAKRKKLAVLLKPLDWIVFLAKLTAATLKQWC